MQVTPKREEHPDAVDAVAWSQGCASMVQLEALSPEKVVFLAQACLP